MYCLFYFEFWWSSTIKCGCEKNIMRMDMCMWLYFFYVYFWIIKSKRKLKKIKCFNLYTVKYIKDK
jgi:hypothetical protein